MKKLVLALLLVGCTGNDADEISLDDEWGMEGPLYPTPPPGKEDSELRKGLLVNTDTTRTQVWTARNKWEDTETVAAKAAGMAWPANSGLTWDQKYSKWVASLEWIPSLDGFSTTVKLTTPWGKTLPSPSLECAETSLWLRITFAAWYELPLFFETVDSNGARVFFGHNGVRTASGRYASSPEFAIKYKDLTKTWTASQPWPVDTTLKAKKVAGGEDNQAMIAPGAGFGAYLDEIHLNKRAGYFTVMALDYLGSMNIADAANAYNIIPDDVRAGDTLIERWQRSGIGHTLVVKEVAELPGGSKDVTTISGSMPRRQGVRQSGQSSKSYFTSQYTGGLGVASDGSEYAKLGGGIKRWRVTKNVNGYWTNTWMAADEASWINSTDYPRIAARPGRFEQILGQVSPQQKKAELLVQIDEARHHLTQFPASCSARERREQAFHSLYEVGRELGETKADLDAEHRELEDYVLAQLDYTKSKTCCWNSSTSAMFDIIMDKARKDIAAGEASNMCVAPTVFASKTDGYQLWASHAATLGRAADWRAWSEDEACPQKDVAADTEAAREGTAFCSLEGGGSGPTTCTDAKEPNNSRSAAVLATGTIADLQVCAADDDWFTSAAGGVVKIAFTHADGDLDLEAFDASGARLPGSAGTGNTEQVTLPAGGFVRVFGFSGARGPYTLTAP